MSTSPRPLSSWAQNISPSPTLAVDAKAKALLAAGEDVLNFAAGEPDFDTPEHIKEACIAALKGGKTKYAPTPGIEPLRQAVADLQDTLDQAGVPLRLVTGADNHIVGDFIAGLAAGRLFRSADGASANDGDDDRNTTREESRSTSRPSGNTAGSDAAAASSEYDRHVGMGVTR